MNRRKSYIFTEVGHTSSRQEEFLHPYLSNFTWDQGSPSQETLKKIMKNLQKCIFLTSLEFSEAQLTDFTLQKIMEIKWKFICNFDLCENNISNQGIQLFTKQSWPYLTYLHLSCNRIANRGLYFLIKTNMPNLQILNLTDNKLTNDGFKLLPQSQWTNLTYLFFANSSITDSCLSILIKCSFPYLKMVQLQSFFFRWICNRHLCFFNKQFYDFYSEQILNKQLCSIQLKQSKCILNKLFQDGCDSTKQKCQCLQKPFLLMNFFR